MLSADKEGVGTSWHIDWIGGQPAGMPLAAMLTDSVLARAVVQELEHVALRLDSGREVAAFLAVPDRTPAPAVVLFHKWWGLNGQIKTISRGICERWLCSTGCQPAGRQNRNSAKRREMFARPGQSARDA